MSLCGTDYAIGAVRNMYKESRQDNAMVVMPSKLQKGLPRRTGSLCPECLKVIPATLYIGDGALKMKKTCKEHGEFDEVCWSDAEMYLRAENWAFDGVGLENPQIVDAKVCPYECGLCNLHYSATSLCNIDLTNRCNLKCPICFANANAAGYVFEPTFEQIVYEFAVLRAQRPIPVAAIQFAGGEPTIYPQFPEIVKAAKDMGFPQVQVATNGIRLATEDGFLDKVAEAGLNTIYLQFDGLREENYIKARGRPLLDIKLKVIERVREREGKNLQTPTICFVPTMVNSFNDDQAREILNYAINHRADVEGLMEDLWLLAQDTKDKKIKFTSKLKALQLLKRHFKPEEAPEGMGLAKMLKILNRMFTKGDKAGAAEFSWSTMYVGGMHFQDNYNYDIERVKRCVIHYATPDGKVIPFCAYNTGPNFREEIEKKFAVPIEEWRCSHPRARCARFSLPPPAPQQVSRSPT